MPNLKIKTIGNREINCTYEPDDTVLTLKQNIYNKEGIPSDQFKLIYQGQTLDEKNKLKDYKIEAGHVLIMVNHLKGG